MARKKQIKESKQLITEALIRLLNKKSLVDINMTEIAEEADVVRMTLYRHFKSKEDIILYIVEQKIDEFIVGISNTSNLTLYDMYYFRFKLLQESPFTTMLYECGQLNSLFDIIRNNITKKLHLISPNDVDPFFRDFFVGGIDKVTENWIKEGMTHTPKEMANKVNLMLLALRQSTQ